MHELPITNCTNTTNCILMCPLLLLYGSNLKNAWLCFGNLPTLMLLSQSQSSLLLFLDLISTTYFENPCS